MKVLVTGATSGLGRNAVEYLRNKGISVKADIPIYVSYFTAWPNKDGTVEYFDDVYGRDDYVRKAFAATQNARKVEG